MERKHAFQSVIALGVLILVAGRPVAAQYSGGAGTPDDPYQIATAQDLIDLGNTPADYGKHFLLTADVDLTDIPFERAVIAGLVGRTRGAGSEPFSGVLDGDEHVIRHLRISGHTQVGLFGTVAKGAVISDLSLENASVEASGDNVGALAGRNEGVLLNCYSTGAVTGGDSIGGLVGYHSGTLSNCYSLCTTTGADSVGGLAGNNTGNVSRCYSNGPSTGNDNIGGLVGASSGTITTCYSTGAILGVGAVGGLVGNNSGSVASSFWDVETSQVLDNTAGVGLTTVEMQGTDTYLNAGWDFVGESANGTAETWQMSEVNDYPRLSVFKGYEPVLPAGQGTPDEPFLITNAQELGSIGARPWASYRLEADIDLGGITWTGAVVPWFRGDFNGSGHMIRHLQLRGAGFLGLFGALDAQAGVRNLRLEHASILGTGDMVGALAGRSEAVLVNCYSDGVVTGNDRVGALVGYNLGSILTCASAAAISGQNELGGLVGFNHAGRVSGCYSTSPVTGNRWLGGLVGGNAYGNISNCYSVGSVDGYDDVGGLVGNSNHASTIIRCYSTGAVIGAQDIGGLVGNSGGEVRHCFWDVDTSGVAFSADGAGLTTAEMMDPDWIGLQGWAGDPNWVLDAFGDYPRLAWEGTPGLAVPEPVMDWIAGTGTSEAPYELSDASQLFRISKASLLWEKDFLLVNDLDLAGMHWPQAIIPSFAGTFDGSGHRVKNLTVTGRHYLGFFGRLGERTAVLDLGMVDADITGSGDRIGALVGYNEGGGVWNCSSSGAVAGDGHVGGLVGENEGSLRNCHSAARVAGNDIIGGLVGVNSRDVYDSHSTGAVTGEADYVGGLIGWNAAHVTVSDCYSTSAVTGRDDVGGLIGFNFASATVLDCFSTGAVTGHDNVGGLIGYNRKNISRCFSTSTVTGTSHVGGLIGHNHTNATVSNCHSTGRTQGRSQVGGLVGSDSRGDILNCYSVGRVTGNEDIGGLVGHVESASEVDDSFWDTQTSGLTASAGGLGLTTSTMQEFSTYLIAGWDLAGETANGAEDIWRIDDGHDYPRLRWEAEF